MQQPSDSEEGRDADVSFSTGKTDWDRVLAMTEEELHQNALDDPDNPPLTDEQLARMRRVPNPQEIRQKLGLTQREFARQFQIALGTLRDWEQGARRPDSTARAYLWVIEENPDAVRAALEYPKRSHPTSTAPAAPPARAAS
jgi:putative transcriptional regulator